MSGTMKSTRQFTKRRVQPSFQQQQVNGIPTMAGNTPINASAPVQAKMNGHGETASLTPSKALPQGFNAVHTPATLQHAAKDSSANGLLFLEHNHNHETDVHQSQDEKQMDNSLLSSKPYIHHGHAHHDHHHGYNQQDFLDNHAHHPHYDHHSYAPIHTPQLPSWSEIFSALAPMQKTVFTWFSIHLVIGMVVWWAGVSRDSLAIVAYSYLVIFDALGVLNLFVSDIVRTNPAFQAQNPKRPFGARRYEIVFAMATTVYLLFVTMYTTKESVEHMLMEVDDDDHHSDRHLGFTGFLVILLAMGATFLSSVNLRNHDQFVRYLRRAPTTVHGFSYNVLNRTRGSAFNVMLSNIYSLSVFASGAALLFMHVLGMVSPFMDKFVAFGESAVMFYLGGPTAVALAKLLLQTTPDAALAGIEARLMEIRQNPNIIALDRIHFWQSSYGKYVGTLEVQIRAGADETSVLQFVYQKLEGLTSTDATTDISSGQTTRSELTVSIVKP